MAHIFERNIRKEKFIHHMLNVVLHSTLSTRLNVQCEFYEVLKSESTVHVLLCQLKTFSYQFIQWYVHTKEIQFHFKV